jgi:hypothetical protein
MDIEIHRDSIYCRFIDPLYPGEAFEAELTLNLDGNYTEIRRHITKMPPEYYRDIKQRAP